VRSLTTKSKIGIYSLGSGVEFYIFISSVAIQNVYILDFSLKLLGIYGRLGMILSFLHFNENIMS